MEYDAVTARHYAAYRPPLHAQILERGLGQNERYQSGLDIGCGTGHSTRALLKYCDEATGVDPSSAMITLAEPDHNLTFVAQTMYGGAIDQGFLDGDYDLFSFAGSLDYQDPGFALEEVSWLATEPATIIVYDFDVLLAPVFSCLGVNLPPSDYDHRRNFRGVEAYALKETLTWEGKLDFLATAAELAHLLLSVRDWREGPLAGWTYDALREQLKECFTNEVMPLAANGYLTRYSF